MITQVEKKFFEIDESIFTIIGFIQGTQSDYIVLVFPVGAFIFVGITNFLLIDYYARLYKHILIGVTEDDYGLRLIQKAGLVGARKMSQITLDLWNVAEKRTFGQREQRYLHTVSREFTNFQAIYPAKNKHIADKISDDGALLEDFNRFNIENNSYEEMAESSSPSLSLTSNPLNDIEEIFHIGIDIKKFQNQNDIIQRSNSSDLSMSKNFIGNDLGKVLKTDQSKLNLWSKIFKTSKFPKKVDFNYRDESIYTSKKIYFFIFFLAVVVLAFFGISLVLSELSIVELNISFKSKEFQDSYKLLLTEENEELRFDDFAGVLKGTLVFSSEIEQSTSKTVSISSKTTVGTKAKGVINLYNLTDQILKIPKNTKLISSVGQKQYVILQDIEIPAISQNLLGEKLPHSVDDIPIEAFEVGEIGNLQASSGDDNFFIDLEGWKDLTKASGRIFRDLKGGTSSEVFKVLKSDVDIVSKEIEDELRALVKARSRNQTNKADKVLFDYMKWSELKITVSPEIGQISEDGVFNISGTLSGKAPLISEISLMESARMYFSLLQKLGTSMSGSNFVPEIKNTTFEDNILTIEIGFRGDLGPSKNTAEIFEMIKGKTESDARKVIESIVDLEKYMLTFKPGYIPEFLKKIPQDPNKVQIRIN